MNWLERHQVPLYLIALTAGVLVGIGFPTTSPALAPFIDVAVALMLLSTFLSIPLVRLADGFRDLRILGVLLGLNFVVVPVVVWGLSRFVAHDQALSVGVLLVLLAPCVDWVIVFTGLAGGDRIRMTATAPVLLLVQMMVLVPLILLISGPELALGLDHGPFLSALLVLLLLPLTTAALIQAVARHSRPARMLEKGLQAVMVPALMAVLFAVTASHIAAVRDRVGELLVVVPLFVAFILIMVPLGVLAARVAKLPGTSTRTVVFSGTARNSLVVLPLALALPAGQELAALAVVTQTVVELLGMVVMVRVVPKMVPATP